MLDRVTQDCSAQGFESLIREAMGQRARARANWPRDHASSLRTALGLAPGRSAAAIRDEMIGQGVAPARWSEVAAFLATGSVTDRKKIGTAAAGRGSSRCRAIPRSCLDRYLSIFFTEKEERLKSLLTKALATRRPDIEAELFEEQARLDGSSRGAQIRRNA